MEVIRKLSAISEVHILGDRDCVLSIEREYNKRYDLLHISTEKSVY